MHCITSDRIYYYDLKPHQSWIHIFNCKFLNHGQNIKPASIRNKLTIVCRFVQIYDVLNRIQNETLLNT